MNEHDEQDDERYVPANPWQRTLWDACIAGDLALIKEAVANGADVDEIDDCAANPLKLASIYAKPQEHIEAVRMLLDLGADTNNQSVMFNQGLTVIPSYLLWAVAGECSEDLVRFLLERGADVNTQIPFGDTALIEAIGEGNLAVARLLLRYGADPTIKNYSGKDAYEVAEACGVDYAALLP